MEEFFNITTEDGKIVRCKVIMTFDSDEHSYVLYSLVDDVGNETDEISALRFELDDEGNMIDFASLETEEEWDMVSEVFNTMIGDGSDEEEGEFFTVTDENGEEFVCKALYRFELKEFGKQYVFYSFVGEKEVDEIFAAAYTPGENGEIVELHPIELDEEWDKVEEQLELLQQK